LVQPFFQTPTLYLALRMIEVFDINITDFRRWAASRYWRRWNNSEF